MNHDLKQNTTYLKDIQNVMYKVQECLNLGGPNELQCASSIMEKSIRDLPFMKNLVYPWRNYDWDYTTYVKNNYDPKSMGVKDGANNLTGIITDVQAIISLINGLLMDPNPSDNSSASNPNSKGNDLVKCMSRLSCSLLNDTKSSYVNQKPPYANVFFNKPLEGEYSSSYFSQIGVCHSNIKSEKECKDKDFLWIPNPLASLPGSEKGPDTPAGDCFKGRYVYINNKPGLEIGKIGNVKGLIPSIANDVLEIAPDKIIAAAMGESIPGVDIQKCEEGYINYNDNSNISIILIIIVIIIILFIILGISKLC